MAHWPVWLFSCSCDSVEDIPDSWDILFNNNISLICATNVACVLCTVSVATRCVLCSVCCTSCLFIPMIELSLFNPLWYIHVSHRAGLPFSLRKTGLGYFPGCCPSHCAVARESVLLGLHIRRGGSVMRKAMSQQGKPLWRSSGTCLSKLQTKVLSNYYQSIKHMHNWLTECMTHVLTQRSATCKDVCYFCLIVWHQQTQEDIPAYFIFFPGWRNH